METDASQATAELHERQKVDYAGIFLAAAPAEARAEQAWLERTLPDRLTQSWNRAYRSLGGSPEIVEVIEGGFAYMFDLTGERAIAAFGRVGDRPPPSPRDASRMAGHPRSLERSYQKGHLIAHRLGGGLDINLVHQLGAANIGPFRRLENQAAKNPGSFYFVRLLYAAPPLPRDAESQGHNLADPQRPKWIEQGLILARQPSALILREFDN